jgi:Flp pilus assembly protein TadG
MQGIKQWRLPRLVQDESGQSLIIVVLAIIALLAFIGLGVDLGLVYVERVRLARAMDAAALAGAQELPIEVAAHDRALEYLRANGYDTSSACVETRGSTLGGASGSCAGSDAETIIIIDTYQFRDAPDDVNTASRINVRATQSVDLTFVRVIGFETMPVSASSTAENIENLDIAVVYDRSGSMQEDTRCYGCWVAGGVYPAGTTYPLPWNGGAHCQPSDPAEEDGYDYISIEAEHYTSYLTEADYHRDWTEFPKLWWAMQRDPNENATGTDGRGAFVMVGPNSGGALYYGCISGCDTPIRHPPDFYTTPRLNYDFTVPADGTYYVWIRAQGGRNLGNNSERQVHVGLGGVPLTTARTCYWGPYNDGASSSVRKNADPPDGYCGTGSQGWSWSRVPYAFTLNATAPDDPYTLNIWASGTGFRLDKIVITSDARTNLDRDGNALDMSWGSSVPDAGPPETHGRTGWACMGPAHATPDPRFAPIDIYGQQDDLYDDYQPIRFAKEAAKRFVRRLNPQLDQIAYVWYSSSSSIREELYCKKRYGSCADFENVADVIESTNAGGNTNIADALWDGLRVLMTGAEPANDGVGFPSKEPGRQHYGRPSAAHILILMTDGQANQYPSLPGGYGNCYSEDLWPDVPGESTSQRRARECVAWFGLQARDLGVVVYTIGLGAQADHELLAHVAELTGGWYYYAPSGETLDQIFDDLYERIFLRLTD